MAIQAVFGLVLTIGGTDYSAEVTAAELTADRETFDLLTFSSSGWKSRFAGSRTWSLKIDYVQDDAANKLRAALWTAYNTAGGKVTVTMKEDGAAATSEANPALSGTAVVPQVMWGGTAGQLKTRSVTLQGHDVLTVATS